MLPPLGVFFRTGCSGSFLLNILLTCLAYFPGLIHAIYVVGKYSSRDQYNREREAQSQIPSHLAGTGYAAVPGPPQSVVRGYPVADQPPPSGYGGGNGAQKV